MNFDEMSEDAFCSAQVTGTARTPNKTSGRMRLQEYKSNAPQLPTAAISASNKAYKIPWQPVETLGMLLQPMGNCYLPAACELQASVGDTAGNYVHPCVGWFVCDRSEGQLFGKSFLNQIWIHIKSLLKLLFINIKAN